LHFNTLRLNKHIFDWTITKTEKKKTEATADHCTIVRILDLENVRKAKSGHDKRPISTALAH